jgi:hypothetical protein
MANTFKNYTSQSVGTTATTVYTVPSATSAVVIGCNLANRSGGIVYGDVQLGTTYLIKSAPLPSGSALSVLDGKMVLEAGDTVVVTSDTASSVDVIISVLEQS